MTNPTITPGDSLLAVAEVKQFQTGTLTDAGTLTGVETVPAVRSAGLFQTSLNSIVGFIYATLGIIKTVPNVAALSALNGAVWSRVKTQGYYNPGDGGHGTYYGLTGAQTADGGAVIAGASGSYFGLEHNGSIHALQYGAYGNNTHDDTIPLQALQAYCWANKLWMNMSGAYVYRTTSTLTLQRPCLYEGGDAVIRPDITRLTAGFAVVFAGGGGNTYAQRSVIRNLRIHGPQFNENGTYSYSSASNTDGLSLNGNVQQIDDTSIDGLAVLGFRKNIEFTGQNVYLIQILNIRCAAAWMAGISINIGANSGEKISIRGGSIFNCITSTNSGCAIQEVSNGGYEYDLYLHDISIDYCDTDFQLFNGRVYLYGCHCESNTANPNITMTYVPGTAYPEFHMFGGAYGTGPLGGHFGNTEPVSGKAEWVNITTGAAGHYRMTLHGVGFGVKSLWCNPQDGVAGYERYVGLGLQQWSAGYPPAINYSTSLVANGRFGVSSLNGWTLMPDSNGSFTYDVSTTIGNSRSCKFTSTVASTSLMQQTLAFVAGDSVIVSALFKITALSAGNMGAILMYYAQDGTLLGTWTFQNGGASGAQSFFTAVTTGFINTGGVAVVPYGTAKTVLQLQFNGVIGTVWVAGINAWKI